MYEMLLNFSIRYFFMRADFVHILIILYLFLAFLGTVVIHALFHPLEHYYFQIIRVSLCLVQIF